MLKILLIGLILYIPNQLHVPQPINIKGINIFNLMLLLAYFLHLAQKPEVAVKAPMRGKIGFYYFVILLSVISAMIHGSHSIVGDITVGKTLVTYSLLYFLFYYACKDLKDIRVFLFTIGFVTMMVGTEILREKLAAGLGSQYRAAGPFSVDQSAANSAGVFMALYCPLFLGLIFGVGKKQLIKLMSIGGYLLSAMAIFYTHSRQSYAALTVTSVFFGMRKSLTLAVLIIVLALNYEAWAPESVVKRIAGTTSQDSRYGEQQLDESTESRFVFWAGAWRLIKSTPSGIGLNQFQNRIVPYLPEWVRARDAHNFFVRFTTEAGIQGIISLLLLLSGFTALGIRLVKKGKQAEDRFAQSIGFAYIASVLALVMGNVFSSTFGAGAVTGNFWILSGLIARYAAILEEQHPSPKPQLFRQPLRPSENDQTFARKQF